MDAVVEEIGSDATATMTRPLRNRCFQNCPEHLETHPLT